MINSWRGGKGRKWEGRGRPSQLKKLTNKINKKKSPMGGAMAEDGRSGGVIPN